MQARFNPAVHNLDAGEAAGEADERQRGTKMQSSYTTVDFSRYSLEPHVLDALQGAFEFAQDNPIDGAAWLQGAIQIAAVSTASAAFAHAIKLAAWPVPHLNSSSVVHPRKLLNLAAIPVSEALATSLIVARKILGEPLLWGRDYITVGLLSHEASVTDLAAAADGNIEELRKRWFHYLESDAQYSNHADWRAWWAMASSSDVTPSEPVTESSPDSDIVFDLEQFDMTPGVRQILLSAEAARHVSITPLDILVALMKDGRPGPDPEWAADFLRASVNQYPSVIAWLRERDVVSRERSSPATNSIVVSPMAMECLNRARSIALSVSASGRIAGRHLLAALIELSPSETPRDWNASPLLDRLGVDLVLLRERLFEWVKGYSDDDHAWRATLAQTTVPVRLQAGFHADGTTGPDFLNIEPDVEALATLIAARDTVTPLSIGLFGDWGSGKTFFMRKLQGAVDRLTAEAHAAQVMQRDLPFYKHVVQIEFNAWHYVEANLWASMVEHILANLRSPNAAKDSPTEEFQRHWLAQLGFAEQAHAGAERASKDAGQQVSIAEEAVKAATLVHKNRTEDLSRLSAESLSRDFRLSNALDGVKEALAPLGLAPLSASAADLKAALGSARNTFQQGIAVFTPLLRAPDKGARWRWLLVALIAPPAAALAIGWVVSSLDDGWKGQLVAQCTGAGLLFSSVAAWLRKQATWVSERLGQIDVAQIKYDEELRKQLAQTAAEKATTEQQLKVALQELAQAETAVASARERVSTAKADFDAATTTRLLGQFIQDRAASSDYRKHLGVLAVVRQDFERLSKLIEEENWRLSPETETADEVPPASSTSIGIDLDNPPQPKAQRKRVTTLEEENDQANVRVNRIVLYIDDLDRCPPEKVVEVLEAVHLLLAFPLFVVVVGVDARWISRSLEARYRHLLDDGIRDKGDNTTSSFGGAKSEDYLEKIFQIPLWLRPMGASDAQRMVRGLLKEGSQPAGGQTPSGTDAPQLLSSPALEAGTAAPIEPSDEQARLAAAGNNGQPSTVSSDPPAAQEPPSTHARASSPLSAERLRINGLERRIIDRLAPLLGRSPRALKRFINVYRLIKAGLTEAELARFAREDEQSGEPCAMVLLLLAVDTGLPKLSRELNHLLVSHAGQTSNLLSIVDGLLAGSPERRRDWETLRNWIKANERWIGDDTTERLANWVPRVSRYSFQASTAEAAS